MKAELLILFFFFLLYPVTLYLHYVSAHEIEMNVVQYTHLMEKNICISEWILNNNPLRSNLMFCYNFIKLLLWNREKKIILGILTGFTTIPKRHLQNNAFEILFVSFSCCCFIFVYVCLYVLFTTTIVYMERNTLFSINWFLECCW